MKKFVSLLLVFAFCFTSYSPFVSGYDGTAASSGSSSVMPTGNIPVDMDRMVETAPFEFLFNEPSSDWRQKVADQEPAVFEDVSYTLAPNVVLVDSDITRKIASAGQILTNSAATDLAPYQVLARESYIPTAVLENLNNGNPVEPGTIYVNEAEGTAFKVMDEVTETEVNAPFKDMYSVAIPDLNEVLTDFKLGAGSLEGETVQMTLGNISGFADNIEEHVVMTQNTLLDFGDKYKKFAYLKNPLVSLQFPEDTTLDAYSADGTGYKVVVNGGLGIGDFNLTGKYTGFSGYKIALSVKQEAYLSVMVQATIKEEIRIPIIGFDVSFGVGRVCGGLFIIVNLDGSIRLEVAARQFLANTVGIRGKTAFYVPCSFRPFFSIDDSAFEGDVQISGQINGTIRAGAMVQLQLFGLDLVGAGVFIGVGLTVAIDGLDLDLDIYGIVQAYITFFGKSFNLINLHESFLRRKQRNTGGYRIQIMESYADPPRVAGIIEAPVKDTFERKADVPFRVLVTAADSSVRYYPAPDSNGNAVYDYTNAEGEFFRGDVVLNKDDMVAIEFLIDGNPNALVCEAVPASMPYTEIVIGSADYFNEYVTGQVKPASVINWDATGDEPQMSMVYYQGPVTVLMSTGGNPGIAMTDEQGYFNTSIPFQLSIGSSSSGKYTVNTGDITIPWTNNIDVRPDSKLSATIKRNGFVITCTSKILPSVNFELSRVITPVSNSEKHFTQGDKAIDQLSYIERLWIINLNGTKAVESSQVEYQLYGFSTKDKLTKGIYSEMHGGYISMKTSPESLQATLTTPALIEELDEEGNSTGSAMSLLRVNTQWVWQPHKHPTTITSADTFETGTDGSTFEVTATGNPTLFYTLIGAPEGVVIDKATGIMTIPANMEYGDYPFTIHVEESALSMPPALQIGAFLEYKEDPSLPDEQEFVLTISENPPVTPSPAITEEVTPTPTAEPTPSPTPTLPPVKPVINQTDCSMTIYFTSTASTKMIRINDDATKPVTFSLEKVRDTAIPRNISINKDTGLLTVAPGLSYGQYLFYVVATNSVGSDKQMFTLNVNRIMITKPSLYFKTPKKAGDAEFLLNKLLDFGFPSSLDIPLATAVSPLTPGGLTEAEVAKGIEPFVTTLTNDHTTDLFSRQQFKVNGAEYVKWECLIVLTIEGKETLLFLEDDSPLSDHHLTKKLDIDQEALNQEYQKRISDFTRGDTGWNEQMGMDSGFGMDGSWDDGLGMDFGIDGTFLFDYGAVLNGLNGGKGTIDVNLGGSTGTFVPGDLFVGLQNEPRTGLNFIQDGCSILFKGKDITQSSEIDLYNFAYSTQTPGAQTMKSAVSSDAQAFTYGFAHHGALPGMAVFSVTTGFAEGTSVNVYKLDAATGGFIEVAAGKKVGANGLVTYENNTMSEYVITTATIKDAIPGENPDGIGVTGWIIIGCAGMVILVLSVLLILKKRNKSLFQSIVRRKNQKQ